jgi:hypothetical protein
LKYCKQFREIAISATDNAACMHELCSACLPACLQLRLRR